MLFTHDNAREMARRSNAVQRERKREAKLPLTTGDYADTHVAQRLARVRKQLALVDSRIEREAKKEGADGQLLNWLCAAQERLNDQEFALSARPKPGNMRVAHSQPIRRPPSSGPLGLASDVAINS